MDPGAALVTAYPLPPDYFREFDGESIRNIHPPSPPTVDCSVFGHYILKEARWTLIGEPFSIEGAEIDEQSSIEQLVRMLKEAKEAILLNYIQLLGLVITDDTEAIFRSVEALTRSQQAAMVILAHLGRHQNLLTLSDELKAL